MAKELPKLAKHHKFYIQEVQQTSSKIDKTDPHLDTLTVKLLRLKEQVKIWQAGRKNDSFKGNHNKFNNRIFKRNKEVKGRGIE